jgi:hypothetical protein
MDNRFSSPPSKAEYFKLATTLVTTSDIATHFSNPEVASRYLPLPPPHLIFIDAQREIIMELCRDNDKQIFFQEMMEKCLD